MDQFGNNNVLIAQDKVLMAFKMMGADAKKIEIAIIHTGTK